MHSKKKIDQMPDEESIGCLAVMIAFVPYAFLLFFVIPKPIPDYIKLFLLPLLIFATFTLIKKYRQRTRPKETIFTEEKRNEWLKRSNEGFFKYTFWSSVRFGFALSIYLFLGLSNSSRSFSFLYFLGAFALGVLLGVTVSGFEWWNNLDNEKEWQRKHAQIPPQ